MSLNCGKISASCPYKLFPYSKKKGVQHICHSPLSQCALRLFYHMFGSQMGSLRILRRSSTGGGPSTETLLWSRQDQVGNYWERAEVDLNDIDQPFQVHDHDECDH